MEGTPTEPAQKPLELILARNLLTSISTPAFLVDASGALVYYNDAAGALLGVAFEDSGTMRPSEWTARFGPFNKQGDPYGIEEIELTNALRSGRPAHAEFVIRSADAREHEVAVSALPIASTGGTSGAIVIFWPLDEDEARRITASAGKSSRDEDTGRHQVSGASAS
jgi:PAS domain-containing protein